MAARPTQGVNKWQAEMEADAAKTAAELPVGGGEWLSIKANHLYFKGVQVPGDTMEVVILGYLRENKLFAHAYSGDGGEAPICFAFGNDDTKMAPHEDSVEPQHPACATCPMNQWGSDGKGKACKNVIRLGMVAAGALDQLDSAEVASFTVPRTSVKHFNNYAKKLNDTLKRPPYAVITRISLVPDPKSMIAITFEFVKPIEGDVIGELIEKRKTVKLDTPYAKPEDKPAKAQPRGRFAGARKL